MLDWERFLCNLLQGNFSTNHSRLAIKQLLNILRISILQKELNKMSFVFIILQRRLLTLIIKASDHIVNCLINRKWLLLSIQGSADASSAKQRNLSVLEFIFIIQTTDQHLICCKLIKYARKNNYNHCNTASAARC